MRKAAQSTLETVHQNLVRGQGLNPELGLPVSDLKYTYLHFNQKEELEG